MTGTSHSAPVTDHAFDPGGGPWWGLCGHWYPGEANEDFGPRTCRLPEAAHRDTTLTPEDRS